MVVGGDRTCCAAKVSVGDTRWLDHVQLRTFDGIVNADQGVTAEGTDAPVKGVEVRKACEALDKYPSGNCFAVDFAVLRSFFTTSRDELSGREVKKGFRFPGLDGVGVVVFLLTWTE